MEEWWRIFLYLALLCFVILYIFEPYMEEEIVTTLTKASMMLFVFFHLSENLEKRGL